MNGQHHAPASLFPGKIGYPLYARLGSLRKRSYRAEKPGFDPRTYYFIPATTFITQIILKIFTIGSRRKSVVSERSCFVLPEGQDGRTDLVKVSVRFRKCFAKAPKWYDSRHRSVRPTNTIHLVLRLQTIPPSVSVWTNNRMTVEREEKFLSTSLNSSVGIANGPRFESR